jgi:hypothetical protein
VVVIVPSKQAGNFAASIKTYSFQPAKKSCATCANPIQASSTAAVQGPIPASVSRADGLTPRHSSNPHIAACHWLLNRALLRSRQTLMAVRRLPHGGNFVPQVFRPSSNSHRPASHPASAINFWTRQPTTQHSTLMLYLAIIT